MKLYNQWIKILNEARKTVEFKKHYSYGLYQIEKDINVKVDSGTRNKKREPIMVHKYPDLNSEISNLKDMLNNYYDDNIHEKLLKYELLKWTS